LNIRGVEANANLFWQPCSWLQTELICNYTFQSAQDLTDPNSKTYKHQIPYTPKHSGAFQLSLTIYHFMLSGELILAGDRYALQQNTDENNSTLP
jgi:outer membrane cobalamin receptor